MERAASGCIRPRNQTCVLGDFGNDQNDAQRGTPARNTHWLSDRPRIVRQVPSVQSPRRPPHSGTAGSPTLRIFSTGHTRAPAPAGAPQPAPPPQGLMSEQTSPALGAPRPPRATFASPLPGPQGRGKRLGVESGSPWWGVLWRGCRKPQTPSFVLQFAREVFQGKFVLLQQPNPTSQHGKRRGEGLCVEVTKRDPHPQRPKFS